MLTTQLRELEADGLVSRKIYAEVPPRVDYSLMLATLGLAPVMNELIRWYRQFSTRRSAGQVSPAKRHRKGSAANYRKVSVRSV